MLSNPVPFLRGWSRDPVAVGWPFASSCWTARRLAQAALDAAIPGGGPVLELGAGTGPVTEALIEAGRRVDDIIVVERDKELCRTLEKRFRGLPVLHGNAIEIREMLSKAHVPSVSVVLSGLPMRAVKPDAAARCYSGAFQLMPSGGTIIQYTYGYRSPVDLDKAALKLDATFVGREWRNVPPMGIWRYRLRAMSSSFAHSWEEMMHGDASEAETRTVSCSRSHAARSSGARSAAGAADRRARP
jgi:phosphatidylethanolamine/phosphatidyl-N-methylethanolamine N-methyltransferase